MQSSGTVSLSYASNGIWFNVMAMHHVAVPFSRCVGCRQLQKTHGRSDIKMYTRTDASSLPFSICDLGGGSKSINIHNQTSHACAPQNASVGKNGVAIRLFLAFSSRIRRLAMPRIGVAFY